MKKIFGLALIAAIFILAYMLLERCSSTGGGVKPLSLHSLKLNPKT